MPDEATIHDFRAQWANEREMLADADIDDRDRDAIERWVDARFDDLALSSILTNAKTLRNAAERAEMPLVEMDYRDVTRFVRRLDTDHGLAEATLAKYRTVLRQLFDFLDREWAADISTRNATNYEYSPERMWTPDEQQALIEAADNARDKAFIAVMFETAQRIGAIGTLTVGDVEFKDAYSILSINEDAEGLKGASGKVPLTWSSAYLLRWMDVHPASDDPDAALFTCLPSARNVDAGDFLRYGNWRRRIRKAAEAAGLGDVDPAKLRPHNIRHTRAGEFKRNGEDNARTSQLYMKWAEGSDQWDVYGRVSDDEMIETYLEERGVIDEAAVDDGGRRFDACPFEASCGVQLPPGTWDFCPSCGRALSADGVAAVDSASETARADSVTADEPSERVTKAMIREWIEDDPGAVAEALHQSVTSEMADR